MSSVGMSMLFKYDWVQPLLISARGSMILGVISAIISVFIGWGLRRFAGRSRKRERVLDIVSVFFCIVPAWVLYRFLGEYLYYTINYTINRSLGRAAVCGILGWRLPYRIEKMSKSSLAGMMCLSAGRNIMLECLTGLQGWNYNNGSMATLGWCLQRWAITYDTVYLTSSVVMGIMLFLLLFVTGKHFLYPRSKKELFIDLL